MLVRSQESGNNLNIKVSPSARLLRAAISGLVAGFGAAGCDDKPNDSTSKTNSQEVDDQELTVLCADMVAKAESKHADAGAQSEPKSEDLDVVCKDKIAEAKASVKPDVDALCKDNVDEAKKSVPKPDTATYCADTVKSATETALKPKTSEEKTINAEQKEYTFAELTKLCDDRGGYAQIHAACGSQNTCKGFSYGDWGPGAAILSEHSCSGANGCLGLSCVVGPDDKHGNKSGKELYELDFGDAAPSSCKGCHGHAPNDDKDPSYFGVYVMAGSTRTESNWLELSQAEQERKVAFGVHYTDGQGREIQNMAPYIQTLSRKEIERVVAHLRTLKPVIRTIKVADPQK